MFVTAALLLVASIGPAWARSPAVAIDALDYRAGRLLVEGSVSGVPEGGSVRLVVGTTERRADVVGGVFREAFGVDTSSARVCARVHDATGEAHGADCRSVTLPVQPHGRVEAVQGGEGSVFVAGWAIDPQTASPIDVSVRVAGVALAGRADGSRRDVARRNPGYGPNHGFRVFRTVPPGTHEVCVTARNVGAGDDVVLGCAQVVVVPPAAVG